MEEGPVHGDLADEGPHLEDEVKGGQRDMAQVTSDPSAIRAHRATEMKLSALIMVQ